MGLKEELQAVDPERYSSIRREVEEEWERTTHETRKEEFLAFLSEYPALTIEVQLAISSAEGWDGGTMFGSQEFGAERESLIGAVSLMRYAESFPK